MQQQQPTTLDLVLQISHGALLVPLKKTAAILGLETQTLRNRLSEKKFALDPVKIGRLSFFRASEIATLIDGSATPSLNPAPSKGRGRPRKSSVLTRV